MLQRDSFVTQPRGVNRKKVNLGFLPRINFKREETDSLPREDMLRFIQEDSLFDSSKCIDFDPELVVKESRLRTQLCDQQEEEHDLVDGKEHRPVHKRSVEDYYRHYKRLVRIKEQNSLLGCKSSAFTALLDKSVKLNALPVCMGFIKNSGSQSKLEAKNFKLGDNYAEMLSEGLAHNASKVSLLSLSSNRITDKGASEILRKVAGKVRSLDLSYNQIETLQNNFLYSLSSKDCILEKLILERNRLHSASVTSLLNVLLPNRSLIVLNLSENNLASEEGILAANLLEHNQTLCQLYLRWNKLGPQAGQSIFQALVANSSLRVLDLSFNLLGGGSAGSAISEALKKNSSLVHLDLSQNKFSLQESQLIAEALKKNHSLYGFHFGGNFGFVDSKGFLVIEEEDRLTRRTYTETNQFRIEGVNVKKRIKRSVLDFEPAKNVCWICEGWTEHSFQVQKKAGCWVHLSHEGYQGRLMSADNFMSFYKTMVPPGKLFYFYTVDGKAFNQRAEKLHAREAKRLTVKYLGASQEVEVQTEGQRSFLGSKVFSTKYRPAVQVRPRFEQNEPKREKVQEQKWSYQISVWYKEWKPVDEDTNLKCFERDWGQSRIPKLVKAVEDQDKVRRVLLANYPSIRNVYKYFSAISPVGDTWSITANAFSQFCNTFKIVDSRLPIKILDLVFITTNSATAVDWRGNPRNPERGIIRFQFLESLIRLADQKYIKNNVHQCYFDAVSAMLNENLVPLFKQYNGETWRTSRYFREENDVLIKRFRPVLEHVFKRYSKLKVKPGEKPFMSNDEFKAICLRTEMTSGRFEMISEKDASISYNLSMMVQVDELESERIFRMQFIEFVEAFARMCDLAVPPRLGLSDSEQPKALRDEYPLHFRFEWGICQLVKTCCADEIKQAYLPQLVDSMFQR